MTSTIANISRASFIKGTAGAAALGAVAPLVANAATPTYSESGPIATDESWLGEEPRYTEDQIAADVEADVVIIGAGIAGVCAARAVIEEGGSAIVIEKGDSPQGRGSDVAVINGSVQESIGRLVDADAVVDEVWKECNCRTDRAVLSRWAKESGEAFDWLLEALPDLYMAKTAVEAIPDENASFFAYPHRWPSNGNYNSLEELYPIFPVTFYFKPSGTGFPSVPAHVFEYAQGEADGRLTGYFGSFAKKLLRNDDGRVTGCIFEDEDGNAVRATGTRAVILATGDFAADPVMLARFCPDVAKNGNRVMSMNQDVNGDPLNTGDGHRMAVWAGAALQQSPAPMIHHMGGVLGIAPYLLVNSQGKRFCNEDITGQQIENQIEAQPGQFAYQIFDAKWPEQLAYMPEGHGVACFCSDDEDPANRGTDRCYKHPGDVEEAVEKGSVLKGETVEELLAQLEGVDAEQALATVERYNELARAGFDEDFAKPSKRLFPIEEGPFYAVRFGLGSMLVCIAGVRSDEDCRTYDDEGNAIPGLYVAGNMQGGHFAVEYPVCVPGISHSLGIVTGRDAGIAAYNQL